MIRNVERAVDALISPGGLVPAGPELLKGAIVLSFFERRRSKALFGLVKNEDKIVWEQWTIPLLISTTPRPLGDDDPSRLERSRADADADRLLRQRITDIHKIVNGPIDHVPNSMYEFEISKTALDEPRKRPSMLTPPSIGVQL